VVINRTEDLTVTDRAVLADVDLARARGPDLSEVVVTGN
jgi:hypothetical protein